MKATSGLFRRRCYHAYRNPVIQPNLVNDELAPSTHFHRLAHWFTAIVMLIICAALLIADAPYLHDFAEWVYQAQIVKETLFAPETVSNFVLVDYPVPNALATILIAALSMVMPAIWAAKLFLALMLLGWYIVIRLFSGHHVDPALRETATLILFTTAALANFFWYGFVSYQLGLLLLTWFLAIGEERTKPWTIAMFSVAIFFTHAMIFLVFGLLILCRWIFSKDMTRLLALMPATALSLWFLWGRQVSEFAPPEAGAQWAGLPEVLLYKFGYPAMLGPFRNFLWPDGRSLLEDQAWVYWLGFAANIVTTALLAMFVVFTLWRTRYNRGVARKSRPAEKALVLAILLLGALYLVAPYNFFGLINPGGRLLLPIIILAFILARSQPAWILRCLSWMVTVFTLLTSSSYLYLMAATRGSDVVGTELALGRTLPNSSVFDFNSALYGNTRFEYFNYRIFAFADRYARIEAHDYDSPGFQTGLILPRTPSTD